MTKTLIKPALAKFTLATAALALAFAPVTASAGTRAGDNSTVYTASASQPGQGRSVEGESIIGGFPIAQILIGLYFTAFTAIFVNEVVIEDGDDGENINEDFQSAGV